MPNYNWITFAQAKAALALRLADPTNLFWTDAENGLYLIEALRTWNSLTEQWNAEFSFQATSLTNWYNIGTMPSSPRLRSVTDSDLYTVMQYHLLEPPTGGGVWTGTSQFSLADFQQSLQRRRDEVIQMTRCNLANFSINNTGQRMVLPDTTLEPLRIRFVPAPGFGSPVTMNCEDKGSFMYFEPDYLTTQKMPEAWSVAAEPPLAFDVDYLPPVAGDYDVIALQSGPAFAPPASTLMSMPDDWTWVAKWGALSDLLGRESEATDRIRADYCLKRYQDGLKIMAQSNWLSVALINNRPVDTTSVAEQDCYQPEWMDSDDAWPAVVAAGTDFLAVTPRRLGTAVLGVVITVLGNAPVPNLDADFVQVSRDVFDVVLDYAQHLAAFKMGGQDFLSTTELMQNFYNSAAAQNQRLNQLSLYFDTLHVQGQRQVRMEPRTS